MMGIHARISRDACIDTGHVKGLFGFILNFDMLQISVVFHQAFQGRSREIHPLIHAMEAFHDRGF